MVHILVENALSSAFEENSPEYAQLLKRIIASITAGGEAAEQAGRISRLDAACRM
jgi:hypothetical protein